MSWMAAAEAVASLTSKREISAPWPRASRMSSRLFRAASSRPFRTTCAPAPASACAMAQPSPRDDPVTSATCPVRSKRAAGLYGEAARSAIVDPRVDVDVEDVHDQVDEDVEREDHQDAALDQRVVPAADRLDHEATQSRIGEHRLGDHGAADEAR